MPNTRHRAVGPIAGSVGLRTYEVSFERDYAGPVHWHGWDQLTVAATGTLSVRCGGARRLVPSSRAVWIPARARHAELLHGPATMRTLYFAPRLVRRLPRRCAIVDISPLLHELIAHVIG